MPGYPPAWGGPEEGGGQALSVVATFWSLWVPTDDTVSVSGMARTKAGTPQEPTPLRVLLVGWGGGIGPISA